MPSFRMHLRAHGMVAMVFKTLDDSQHHQVWVQCVFHYGLTIPVYFCMNFVYAEVKVKHPVQCASGISGSIVEIRSEMTNKSTCVPVPNSPSAVYVLLGLEILLKNHLNY